MTLTISLYFLLQKTFDVFLGPFFRLQKDFGTFHMLLLRVFLCVFDDIHLSLSYVEKKFTKKEFYKLQKSLLIYDLCKLYEHFMNRLKSALYSTILYLIFFFKIFFIRIFFIRIFFIRIFSIRIRRKFYVISNILRHLFFFNNIFIFF